MAFEEPSADVKTAVTAAYHEKYDRYGPKVVGTVVSAKAVKATLRIIPA